MSDRYLALGLSTAAYLASFAVWTLVGALAPVLREAYELSATETGWLVTAPVLLGALGRIPVGLIADRYGGHGVLVALMMLVIPPAVPAGFSPSGEDYHRTYMHKQPDWTYAEA